MARLRELRERIERNRATAPLFDIERFRRHIEAAYVTMLDRQRRGDEPVSFTVEPIAP
jgi:predicted O-linked N-acetylglucosamine transferase (SPINDLY family)